MTIDEPPETDGPAEQPTRPRPLSAAETLARALGTATTPGPPAPPAESVEVVPETDGRG